MFQIRAIGIDEYDKVLRFYDALIVAMTDKEFCPKWKKGIYPTEDFLRESIEKKELFVGVIDEKYVGAMVINHEYAEEYENVQWGINANQGEVSVVHILGISYEYQSQGLAKKMVAEVINIAKENNQKAIRLDVLKENIPAQKLYSSIGFKPMDTVRIFYEDTGTTDFILYEYIL